MSDYMEMFEKKFKRDNMSYAEEMDYLFMLNAPNQYGVEKEIMEYWENNPNATVKELYDFFDELVPDGTLPIGDDGSDLLSEE